MQIRLNRTILAAGLAQHEPPQALAINGESLLQESPLVRATEAVRWARGNASTSVSFRVTRRFDTVEEASREALEISGEHTGISGTLVFTTEVPLEVTRRYMPKAIVTQAAPEQRGNTLSISYTIRGGLITKTKPAS